MSAAPARWEPIPLAEGVWTAERPRLHVPLRAVALRLADGGVAVYSPIKDLGPDAHRALKALGPPALLIAPNHHHYLGLPEFAATYPQASIVASAVALARVRARTRCEVGADTALRARLPPHVSVLVPPGTRGGELWLSLATQRGRAWVVGDAFFNIARVPPTPIGLLLRALRVAPGLRIGDPFRWLVRDRPAYRRFVLDALHADRPTTLIPCHGQILADGDLPERLERLIETRL